MVDRTLVYAGQEVLDIDKAAAEQFGMISDGMLAEAIVGSASWAYGLACAPTAPASMSLTIGRGALGQMSVVDQNNPGTAQIANTADALMKIGINLEALTLTFAAPTSAGQSQNFLVQGQMLEADGTAAVEPFFNASNPSQPFAGQNNSGGALNTRRTQRASIQTKAGAPAGTGSQATPSADAGWVPLYIITVPNGATALSAANIAVHPQAPFIAFPLASLRPGFSNQVVFSASGTFTPPNWCNKGKVRVWGGGGGGGGCSATNSSGSGGGGGGYAEGIVSFTPGQPISVTVGAGGNGGAAGGANNGTSGGASSFGGLIQAAGGSYGLGSSNGIATPGGAGGAGTGGTLTYTGASGNSGYQLGTNVYAGGTGGYTFGASIPPVNVQNSGAPGTLFGGGGNGASTNAPGGNGAQGLIILEY